MSKQKILLFLGLFSLVGITLILSTLSANLKLPFTPKSLIGPSDQEINRAAIEYTYYRFEVLSGVPTVLLNMPVTKGDLPSLGLSSIGSSGGKRPMALVLLEGDFDLHNIRGWHHNSPLYTKYIVYVIDLEIGMPTYISGSSDGASFDKLLSLVKKPKELPIKIESNAPVLESHREPQPTVDSSHELLIPELKPLFDFGEVELPKAAP